MNLGEEIVLKSTNNQIANAASNPFQGKARKVLCVCSAGMLRSPTLANVLHKELGYNTRAVGLATEYALTPMSQAHVAWADEIVFVDEDCKTYLSAEDRDFIDEWGVKTVTLHIPDNFPYGDGELETLLLTNYVQVEL